MKQILRYSLVALLAMVFAPSFAEDVIWQEDWSGWTEYEKNVDFANFKSNYAFTGTTTNTDGSYKGGTGIYNENSAGGTAPELLVAKSGGTFTATINLNGKSGDMSLSFKSNKNLTITVTGGTLGTNTGSGNDYLYAITGASGTLTIEFKNALSSNARLDNIKLYQGSAKKAAGITWGKSSTSVTFGNSDDTYKNIPTLQNANNLSLTCTSSNPAVATVTNAGEVTVVGPGNTTIKASFAGNEEYEAAEVSFELTVNPAPSTTPKTIAEFNDLSANTKGVLQLTNAQVLGVGNNYFVVKDATGVIMIKDGRTEGAITASQGQKLSGTINGTKTAFGGLNGIMTITASEITVAEGTITPTTVAVTEIAGKEHLTELYKLENVTVKANSGKYFIMNGETQVIQIYDEFKLNAISADGTYTLEGLRGKYNTTEQFWPTKVTLTTNINITTAEVDANAPSYNLAGQKVDNSYKGLIIKNGKKVINK